MDWYYKPRQSQPTLLDQLMVELKGGYTGLVMIEAKYSDLKKQSMRAQRKLSKRDPLKALLWEFSLFLNTQLLLEKHDVFLASHHPSLSSQPVALMQQDQPSIKLQRLKQGIPGYVNGERMNAFPDTGSAQNVVSAAFAKERGLHIRESEEAFRLGNSKITKSTGKLINLLT